MKPIQLKIAGLQSYREMQEIDFTSLCDAGVFGIFGPTGSGKSSILDAMTLALYGKVERAVNGTQGIMNQVEHALSVSFTFELSGEGKAHRYRVERQYKRTNDVSISCTVCRFIEARPEGDQVLADKQNEVNQRVEELLGLSMHDFTRAVVLPQGKFAEFLSLKGTERRQMLQRLFHLEQYGDVLNARLAHRFKETDSSMKQIEAEQQGLRDASEQAVEQAQCAYHEASGMAEREQAGLSAAEKRFDEQKQIWSWQQEKQQIQAGIEKHRQQKDEIAEKERLLERVAQAETLRPFMEDFETAGRALERESERCAAAQREHTLAAGCQDEADKAYREAQGRLASNEGTLLVRLNELEQASLLEKELEDLRASQRRLSGDRRQVHASLQAAQEQLLKEKDRYEKAVKKQAELKEQLKGCEVKSDARQLLIEAYQDKQALDTRREQYASLRDELAQKEKEYEDCKKEAAEASDLCAEINVGIQGYIHELLEQATLVRQLEHQLQIIHNRIPIAMEQLRKERSEIELQRLASRLAEQLTEHMPCPVCGSSHHPLPAIHSEADVEFEQFSHTMEQLDKYINTASSLLLDAKQTGLLANSFVRQMHDGFNDSSLVEAAAAVSPTETDIEFFRGGIIEMASELSSLDTQLEHCKRTVDRLGTNLRHLHQQRNETEKRQHERNAKVMAAETAMNELKKKEEALKRTIVEAMDRWNGKYAATNWEQVEQQLAHLKEMDDHAEDLRNRLDISVPFIEQTQRKINELQQEMSEWEKKLVHLDAVLEGQERLVKEKGDRLRQMAGDSSVLFLISETKSLLEGLRARERQAKQTLEQARAAILQAASSLSAASEARETADKSMQRARERWNKSLQRSDFSGLEQVRQAIISKDRISEWSQEIQTYRDHEKKLASQLAKIEEQLSGRSLSDDEWQECRLLLAQAKERYEEAIQNRARTERDLEDVKNRHVKWKLLAERHAGLREIHSRLVKLQTVFRGNAFVEYIAEEQLMQVSRAASERLGYLTRQRYAIEVDSGGGFIIRDDANGGMKRPVTTLSGGETFLTSLALALALSAQIQLKGQYPLQFFFLDEGFGTLDSDLLETVISALEKLHSDHLTVGVISHVPELRARLPRKLIVQPAEPTGRGSRVAFETI